ncbi:FAD-binding oxidoreductase [Gilvimarinus japonicus]
MIHQAGLHAMSIIIYNNQSFDVTAPESVLDTLLKAGVRVPYSCRAGVCHSCLMVAKDGAVPSESQEGLSDAQKSRGLFLSCSCYPAETLNVDHYDPAADGIKAPVIAKRQLNDSVLELTLAASLRYQAGQHTNLWRSDAIARCYSIASIPSDPHLSFHIALQPNGQFSQWAAQTLQPGDTVTLQAPTGNCYYQAEQNTQPILLAGTGTGIAPLQAIARAALEAGHKGPIDLFVGARHSDDLYFSQPLMRLAQQHSNFQLTELVQTLGEKYTKHCQQGDIYNVIKARFASLNGYQVYLCGADSFVRKLRKQCFFAGVKPRDVHTDAFLAAS